MKAVVTGGARGLGRALALELAARGAELVVLDIDEAGAQGSVELVRRAGGRAKSMHCDVAERGALTEAIEHAREHMGAVDFLANNAGVSVAGDFDRIELDDWRWILEINLWAAIEGCRAVCGPMKAARKGWVLNVGSGAGLLCGPRMAPYNVTKAGVVALSETLHSEMRPHGVNVSVVCPMFFNTTIAEAGRGPVNEEDEALVRRLMERSRQQAPEVARVAVDAVLAGRVHALPMRHGRWLWRLKRLFPESFHREFMSREPSWRRWLR